MLNWAVEEELLDHNPAKNLSVADPVHQQDKRLPFSDWQLQKIFTALEGKSGTDYSFSKTFLVLRNSTHLV
ncbi:MAG: hypothetical protein ACNI26_16925 [Terasakiella sp.]|uniref:hypothetical protein n=1 Tax=unclassified Terasakiella TaxID=2614952 RepID=UPI003B0022DF